MTGLSLEGPTYREPRLPVRLLVYSFALAAPLLTLGGVLLPAAILVRTGTGSRGIALAIVVTLAYAGLLVVAVRRVRVLTARFTPPLPLPGDIWNLGVASPPRRSRNWPLRLRPRRPPHRGKAIERVAA